MTQLYCTLFDRHYVLRALAMARSLRRFEASARLICFCMDEEAERIVRSLPHERLEAVSLEELEEFDPGLRAVRADRTRVEYYWTSTPCIVRFCLDRYSEARSVTYLDADLLFFSSPASLFEELGNGSVMIVPHRYAPQYSYKEAASGTYNVEWLTFQRDERGLEALRWWRDRCLEWCYNRVEYGRMGDQKYLDEWPARFQGVRVLQHPGGGLAPWNVSEHALGGAVGGVTVDGQPLVFYHFHSLQLLSGRRRLLPWLWPEPLRISGSGLRWTSAYPVAADELELVWEPYLSELRRALDSIRAIDNRYSAGFVGSDRLAARRLRSVFGDLFRRGVTRLA